MPLIPYALTYSTSVFGCMPKLVRCEKCDMEYVYILEATAAGEGTSYLFTDNEGARKRSAAQAQAALQKSLDQGCEPVPCPACGTIQQHMLPRARELRFQWMRTWGLIGLGIAGLLTLISIKVSWDGESMVRTPLNIFLWIATGAAFLFGFGMLERWNQQSSRYDPNQEPVEMRKRRGQMFSVSKEEFLRNA